MTEFETIARNNHRSGMNCAMAVYNALATANENKTVPPMPRAEGGKCDLFTSRFKVPRLTGIFTEER